MVKKNKMPLSKQRTMARKQLRKATAFHNNKPEAFYSRKHNQWFKSYENFKKYDDIRQSQYKKETKKYLRYNKNTGFLTDSRTNKTLKNPVSSYRT